MLVKLKSDAPADRWLEHGAVYAVLAISVTPSDLQGSRTKYRLLTAPEPSTPAFHDARLFDVVDQKVSPRWVSSVSPEGDLDIEPAAWAVDGFWEAFFNSEAEALNRFAVEYRRILAEAGDLVTHLEFAGTTNADKEEAWEGGYLLDGYNFAERCAHYRDTNPYTEPVLDTIMIYLATELWDRFFSQTEIRTALQEAAECLVPYAAGEERRGDRR